MKRFISKLIFGFDVFEEIDDLRCEKNKADAVIFNLNDRIKNLELEVKLARMYADDDAAIDELLDYKKQQLRDMSVIQLAASSQGLRGSLSNPQMEAIRNSRGIGLGLGNLGQSHIGFL